VRRKAELIVIDGEWSPLTNLNQTTAPQT
jgi:hypothetical protein